MKLPFRHQPRHSPAVARARSATAAKQAPRHRPPARRSGTERANVEGRRRAACPEQGGAPRPEPRLRKRRQEVARRAGHRRLALVLSLLGAVAGTFVVIGVVHSSLFAARHLVVHGDRHTAYGAVLAASGLSRQPPLIDVNTAAITSAVEALPWVQTATVSRNWPQTVDVTLTERVAIAYATGPSGVALLDVSGRVLADEALVKGQAPPAGLVPLGALTTPAPGQHLAARDSELLAVAGALPASSLGVLTTLERNDTLGVEAELRDGAVVIFGSASELHEKMIALATLLQNKALTAKVRADLRVPAAPVLTG